MNLFRSEKTNAALHVEASSKVSGKPLVLKDEVLNKAKEQHCERKTGFQFQKIWINTDRKSFDKPVQEHGSERILNGTSFDVKYVVLGLDVSAIVSSLWVLITGAVPACLARNTEYNLIKTKVVFMVFSIMAASLFVPIIIGAAVATYVLRDGHKGLTVSLGVLSLLEFIVSIASSVYCCLSPWAACKLEKKEKQKKNKENGNYEKQMDKEELPEYTPDCKKDNMLP
ncbi:unnamed protein product [Mytilus coruscus]|uniref:Uncharacterized protein n=1 Tax=Mytilus coruscus TaxID=42192 RepID=A0A6J8A8C4_MYTCO|nr:unnamed protein product [Mytilus coruscus]